jgi:hypothetical protein
MRAMHVTQSLGRLKEGLLDRPASQPLSNATSRSVANLGICTTYHGLLRLGVSTDAARVKLQGDGPKLSQALYNGFAVDGVLYNSAPPEPSVWRSMTVPLETSSRLARSRLWNDSGTHTGAEAAERQGDKR